MPLLDVRDLSVRFDTHQGTVRAVDRVSFHLEEGEILGLVGESGSGKSVTGLAVMGLVPDPPGVVESGEILWRDRDLRTLPARDLRALRGRDIATVFQDPMTSLNPLLTVGRQLTEVLEVHEGISPREARMRAAAGLGEVGIPDPEARLAAYPHELSGGMRQRVMIAMALLCRPALLIADEPTTALDVTIQAQILELLRDLRIRHYMAILLITHDLGVIAGTADRVHVMYAGRVVETGKTKSIFERPMHPYTRGLLESVPTLDGDPDAALPSIPGTAPRPEDPPPGCAFAERCPDEASGCRSIAPELERLPGEDEDRRTACPVAPNLEEEAVR